MNKIPFSLIFKNMAESKLILAHWNARGSGQPIRNLLEYLQIPYHDKRYTDSNEWVKDKSALKTNFPNLPYLLDGDKTLTESEAIMIYIVLKAKRADLLGITDEEKVHLAQINGVLQDFKTMFYAVVGDKTIIDLQKEFNEKLLPKLSSVSINLGINDFLIGKLSVLDFVFSEMIGGILLQDVDFLKGLPNLKTYYQRFNDLPGIKDYNASGRASVAYSTPGYLNAKWKISP